MSGLTLQLASLHLLRPWWLLGLLLVPLLAWWWRSRARRRSAWQEAVDPHLLPHLVEAGDASPRTRWTRSCALLAAALALMALAGPSVRKIEHPLWQAQAPLVVALDLSPSALARDLPPSRLAQARAKIATLLRERAGGQVALVVFADDAYTVAPLTADAANVALFLDALAPDIMPGDGGRTEAPRADRAIAWSQRLLRNGGFDRGDIVLLTDRADGDALAEAARARLAGYRVSALGLGRAQGGVFDTPAGLGRASLDAASLQRLATSGGGSYRQLTAGNTDLRALGVLDPRSEGATGARGATVASWRDDGYWLLPLVMLLALPLFRRGGALAAVLALSLGLPIHQAQAQAPAQPSDGDLWRRADQQAWARRQDGVAAYRRQQYDAAIAAFSRDPSATGQYNLGNALAKAGRYDEAIAAYDRALKQQPRMDDAIANRKAVDEARKRKPPPGPQQQQRGGDPGQHGGEPGQQQDQSGRQRDGEPQPDPPSSRARQIPPGQARDPMQQRQADAAQRQRMQDALDKQPPSSAQPKPRPSPETAEQRERRIANEAQLQRVPDDPGALLRAKFRLEYERRQGRR